MLGRVVLFTQSVASAQLVYCAALDDVVQLVDLGRKTQTRVAVGRPGQCDAKGGRVAVASYTERCAWVLDQEGARLLAVRHRGGVRAVCLLASRPVVCSGDSAGMLLARRCLVLSSIRLYLDRSGPDYGCYFRLGDSASVSTDDF